MTLNLQKYLSGRSSSSHPITLVKTSMASYARPPNAATKSTLNPRKIWTETVYSDYVIMYLCVSTSCLLTMSAWSTGVGCRTLFLVINFISMTSYHWFVLRMPMSFWVPRKILTERERVRECLDRSISYSRAAGEIRQEAFRTLPI